MCAVCASLRSWSAVSQPSSLGIITSSVITSGPIASTLSRQSWPSIAVATSNPSRVRFTAISCRITSSSSTTSTRPKPCATRARLPCRATSRVRHVRLAQRRRGAGSLSTSPGPHSSGDRAPASGAGCVGSNPTGGAPLKGDTIVPGMNSGLNPADPVLVAAFMSALLHQLAIVGIVFLLLLLSWGAARGWVTTRTQAEAALAAVRDEPKARRLLRIGFGILWLLDGLLQAQPQMAGGLPSQVIEPAASSSPSWVQHLVNAGGTIWSYHPIQAGAASVWIQAGIGMWLMLAVSGWLSRLAGLASVAWGLIVWVFGEAFGGIFAPGLTVLFGAPGAVLIYAVAGALVALPERAWESPRTGRLTLAGIGVFFLGMALLQAWPGRSFWQGTIDGQPG